MRKITILLLLALAAITSVCILVNYIKMDSFSFAWALNFLLMLCVFAFTGILKSPLTSSYYLPKEWERGGKLYKLLGIDFFRKLLVVIGWEKLTKKSNPVEKNSEALAKLYYQTKKSELDHLIIFLIVLGFTIFVALDFEPARSLWLLTLNVLLNLYPIFLQRYNRPRVERLIRLSKQSQ